MVLDKLQCKKNLLKKRIVDSATCDLCHQEEEDAEHLFSKCHFARLFWTKLGWLESSLPSPASIWNSKPPEGGP